MTIHDIARLAGVSITTVSRVINGKHKGISPATRERVMQVVREHNYQPYARSKSDLPTMRVGVGLPDTPLRRLYMQELIRAAYEYGYTPIPGLYTSEASAQSLLGRTVAHGVDGLIWEGGPACQDEAIPCLAVSLDGNAGPDIPSLDFAQLGFAAADALTSRGHQRIACLLDDARLSARHFGDGFAECLRARGLQPDPNLSFIWDDAVEIAALNVTGVVCQNLRIGVAALEQAHRNNIRIPGDLSIICLDLLGLSANITQLSSLHFSIEAFARHCCRAIVARMEGLPPPPPFETGYTLSSTVSVGAPVGLRRRRMIVVGTACVDTILHVPRLPAAGEHMFTDGYAAIPGGRGLNQAVACALLGAEVSMVGRVGKDYAGNMLFDVMGSHGVDTRLVGVDDGLSTGHAYIHVHGDGQRSILMHNGASVHITREDIVRGAALFASASFCLLEGKVPPDAMQAAIALCERHGVGIVLSTNVMPTADAALFARVHFLVLNASELQRILPGGTGDVRQRMQALLSMGVKEGVLCLDDLGVFLCTNDRFAHIPFKAYTLVDLTGATDALAATLATSLASGLSLDTAVRRAAVAARFCAARQGGAPSMIDQRALHLLMMEGG